MNASSSRVQLRAATEATFGSTVSATGRRKVQMTGDSLAYQLNFDTSKNIRSDRQVQEVILLSASAQGGFNIEMMYKEYDDFMESAFQGTWTRYNTTGVGSTITSPVFTTNTLTQTGGTSFATIAKGQWVQINGCTGATLANNGIWQASLTVAATATVLTFEGTPFTAGSATGTVTIRTSRLTNGTTQRSHNLELEFNDLGHWLTFLGMTTSKFSLNAAAGQILTGAFDFMGTKAMPLSDSSNITGTDDVNFPTTNAVMSGGANLGNIIEGGVALSGTYMKSLTFDLDNALRGQQALANLGNVGVGSGTLQISGKMEVYFANKTLYNKFVNNTTSSFSIRLLDDPTNPQSANGYILTVPALEFTGGQLVAGSIDADMMVSLDYKAKIDAVSGKMVLLDQVGT